MRTRTFLMVSVTLALMACGAPPGEGSSELATQPASGGSSEAPVAAASASPAPVVASAAPSSGSAGPLVIVPLHLHSEGPSTGSHAADLRADGTLTMDGTVIARIDGTRVLSPAGDVLLQVSSDGHLESPGRSGGAELTSNGEIIGPGASIVVTAEGAVEAHGANGQVSQAPFRFDAMPANARRTAAVIVALMLIPTEEQANAASAANASAAPSAAPAPVPSPAPTPPHHAAHLHH